MELTSSVLETRLADLVRDDPRCAPVLDRLGLDYCCQGHRTVQEASVEHHVPVSEVLEGLQALGPRPAELGDATAWADLSGLIQHIVNTHHRYVREHQPILQGWLDKLAVRHGARHAELLEVRDVFSALSRELLQHMNKEEAILFPYIEAMSVPGGGASSQCSPFRSVLHPIRAMEQEHLEAGRLLARIRALTDGYQAPADGCTTYRVCFEGLARFEADLHQHVHLENYVLFPRALALEESLR